MRKLAERSQEQIARSLGIKQPSVLKIERQTDLYLSTLRRFIEAAGGKLVETEKSVAIEKNIAKFGAERRKKYALRHCGGQS